MQRVMLRAFPEDIDPETEAAIAKVLGHVWFSCLVAWSNGVGDLTLGGRGARDRHPPALRPLGVAKVGGQARRRPVLWLVALLPLVLAAALLARPSLDEIWQEQRLHFWIVSMAALGGTIVAAAAAEAAGKRADARLFLLAFAFAVAAAGLGLHALATPTVVVAGPNAGFETVVPAGLAVAAVLAAIATMPLSDRVATGILRARRWIWLGFGAAVVIIGAAVVTETGLFAEPPDETAQNGLVLGLGAAGSVLFAFAALRLFSLHRARVGIRMLTAVTIALVLLGDALAVMPIGRTWQASWWEWHLLMVAAFAATAWTLRGELQRESGRSGLLDGLALDTTLERVRRDDATALERIVDALESVDDLAEDDGPVLAMVDDVVQDFDLTDRQGRLLQQAAHALHDNRRLYREVEPSSGRTCHPTSPPRSWRSRRWRRWVGPTGRSPCSTPT